MKLFLGPHGSEAVCELYNYANGRFECVTGVVFVDRGQAFFAHNNRDFNGTRPCEYHCDITKTKEYAAYDTVYEYCWYLGPAAVALGSPGSFDLPDKIMRTWQNLRLLATPASMYAELCGMSRAAPEELVVPDLSGVVEALRKAVDDLTSWMVKVSEHVSKGDR